MCFLCPHQMCIRDRLKAADTGQNFWLVFGLAVLVFCVVPVITDMVVTPKIMGLSLIHIST